MALLENGHEETARSADLLVTSVLAWRADFSPPRRLTNGDQQPETQAMNCRYY